MGVGILAKGPVAIVCPLGGFVAGCLLAGRRSRIGPALRTPGWAALGAVVGAWLVPAAIHALASGQAEWLTNLLFKQTAVRYAASWHHHQPFWYLLVAPLYEFQPTIWLLPGALWTLLGSKGSGERRAGSLLLAGAFVFVLVFFSIPEGKRTLYLLPGYPLLAVWLARDLGARLDGNRSLTWPRIGVALAGALALGVSVAIPVFLTDEIAERGLDVSLWPLIGALALIAPVSALVAWRPAALRSWAAAGLAWALLWGVAYGIVFPAADPLKSAAGVAADVRAGTVAEARGAIVDFRARFGFHLGPLEAVETGDREGLRRLAAALESDRPFWVIVRAEHMDGLTRWLSEDAGVVTIDRERVGDKDYRVLANRAALAPGAAEKR
jgi:4-amino-4-deoxy-L-arabinose transferase-like glycosyltransferase